MRIDHGNMDFIDDTLSQMLQDAEDFTGMEMVATSIYRKDDPGVHGTYPVRGFDVRCRDTQIGHIISSFINQNWKYDPTRPEKKCCMYHDVGRGKHLHFQVHPNTVRV